MKGVAHREVTRLRGGAPSAPAEDEVVAEEPLEIRVAGETLAVTMRTPGADRELAVGFLFAEGVIGSRDDVGRVAHCGRRSVGDVIERCRPRAVQPGMLGAQTIAAAVESLRALQPNFARTGGIHAAALCDAKGKVLVAYEDIGRHNAIDKAVGALLIAGRIPGSEAVLLVVSGRASFEVVQKAAAAGLQMVASVSAASSLAIDLAKASGITLCGFVRNGSMTVYSHPARIA